MTESTIFDTPSTPPATTEPVEQTPAPVVRPEDLLLKTIVNEQGAPKYQSVEDAIKALAASQDHIKRLEQENAQFRESSTKAKTMEELLEALKPKEETAPAPQPTPSAQPDINDVVNRILSEREKERTRTENINSLTSRIKEVYGEEKASEVFYSKAEALGFTKKAINELAADNPKAVLKLLDIADTKPVAPFTPGLRTEGLNNQPKELSAAGGMALGDNSALLGAWRNAGEQVKRENNIK